MFSFCCCNLFFLAIVSGLFLTESSVLSLFGQSWSSVVYRMLLTLHLLPLSNIKLSSIPSLTLSGSHSKKSTLNGLYITFKDEMANMKCSSHVFFQFIYHFHLLPSLYLKTSSFTKRKDAMNLQAMISGQSQNVHLAGCRMELWRIWILISWKVK